ncbi:hypothetical protein PoB_002020500 [Plakobranchus ocellatus]|uniref:Uncharacterized protein n=1 Tax=Plakobranchus ocellatus TaxID=259542 RepID=A0AAV3ZGM8_9GAST|nr:hypothetical protein PoB_002020500 [Plakobranchus ocellatus]
MRAANQNSFGCFNTHITDFAQTTCPIVYFSHSTDKFFLSVEACKDLRIISHRFPSIKSIMTNLSAMHRHNDNPNEHRCNCPPHQTPPLLSTSLSFPATEENRENLEQRC